MCVQVDQPRQEESVRKVETPMRRRVGAGAHGDDPLAANRNRAGAVEAGRGADDASGANDEIWPIGRRHDGGIRRRNTMGSRHVTAFFRRR